MFFKASSFVVFQFVICNSLHPRSRFFETSVLHPFFTVRLNNCPSVRTSVCLSLFLACPQTNHFRGLPSAALWEMQATVKQSMSSLRSRDPDPDPRSWSSSSFIGRFGAKIFSCVWFCPKTTRIFRVFYPQILSVIV